MKITLISGLAPNNSQVSNAVRNYNKESSAVVRCAFDHKPMILAVQRVHCSSITLLNQHEYTLRLTSGSYIMHNRNQIEWEKFHVMIYYLVPFHNYVFSLYFRVNYIR